MTNKLLTSFAVLSLCAAAGPALALEPFVHSEPLRDTTVQVKVMFHDSHPTMVTCTPEQVASIGARGVEHLTELLPVLNARVAGRTEPSDKPVEVLFDAACYPDGTVGLGGYRRGDEKIGLAYEEAVAGGEWGPPKRAATITDK